MFGSIRINLQLSGPCLYNSDIIILLIQTDLPDPVVPATKRCGMDVRSTVIGIPEMVFPRAIGKLSVALI